MVQELDAFFAAFDEVMKSGKEVISIDETGFLTNQLPIRGYGIRGRRLRIAKCHRRRCKTTSIVAISQYGLVASDSFEGNADGAKFQHFLERAFRLAPNSVAILDNATFHKSDAVRQIAERYGVQLMFTPPYSPECNPVEHVFFAAKRAMRKTLVSQPVCNQEDFTTLVENMFDALAESHRFDNYFGPRSRETVRPSMFLP